MAQLRRTVRDLWRAVQPAARAAMAPSLTPPHRAPQLPKQFRTPQPHLRRFDEWEILQDLDGASAARLLKEEDEAAKTFFSDTTSFEERVQAEAAHLLLPEDQAAPEVHGGYAYFQRYSAEGFLMFWRTPVAGGAEELLLDTGALAKEAGTSFAEVTACKVSDDHSILGFVVDLIGDESYELRFRSLKSSVGPAQDQSWNVRIPGVRSFEFLGAACEGAVEVLAVHMDDRTRRANRISHMRVAPRGIVGMEHLLWEECNEAAYLEVFRTKDRKYVLLSSNTKDTAEMRVVRCGSDDAPGTPPQVQLLLARREGIEYFAEHCKGVFYVISNHERDDFAVYCLREESLGTDDGGWPLLQLFFSPPGGLHVTDADILLKWLVLYGHEAAGPRICVVPLQSDGAEAGSASYLANLPSPVGSVEPGVNADPSADTVRFTFRSPLEPAAVFDLELETGAVNLASRREWAPAAGIAADQWVCERVEYPTADGVLVPLTILRARRGAAGSSSSGGDAPRPCLLNVYGAYGSILATDFRPEHICLLRRGWTVAWAHVRGGGERGRRWHAAGRQLEKAQSVRDLVDAVKFLLARGIAAPGALCVKAASAGGLTLGALLNSKESSLVAAAVLEVPFVDTLTGMLDPSLPLTVHEFAEWGDPRDSAHEANLRSLSPYENVGSHRYPMLYISCARADARVPAWMPLKYAARVKARAAGYVDNAVGGGPRRRSAARGHAEELPQVVLVCSDGGHGGAMDWHGRSEEFSRQLAFLHKAIGLPLQ